MALVHSVQKPEGPSMQVIILTIVVYARQRSLVLIWEKI